MQLPFPPHTPTSIPIPSVQLAAPHAVIAPAYPSQVVAVMPSHSAAAHGLSALPVAHAGREPTGWPTTGVHVPAVSITLHASHCPLQSELQQTPSTQTLLVHSSTLVHAVPFAALGTHDPCLQYAVGMQSPSVVQFVGHDPFAHAK